LTPEDPEEPTQGTPDEAAAEQGETPDAQTAAAAPQAEEPPTAEEAEPEAVAAPEPEAEEAEAEAEAVAAPEPEAEEAEPTPRRARRRGSRGSGRSRKPAEEPAPEPAAPAPAPAPVRRRASAGDRAVVVRAQAKYVRTSARKARIVCVHLRGKSVADARATLAYTNRAVARNWSKVLESAVANAENNHELLEDDLVVREAYADEGPTIKRFRPRAMGRATPIHKRTSHLTITLTPKA
jgi:ribosomal protein L22